MRKSLMLAIGGAAVVASMAIGGLALAGSGVEDPVAPGRDQTETPVTATSRVQIHERTQARVGDGSGEIGVESPLREQERTTATVRHQEQERESQGPLAAATAATSGDQLRDRDQLQDPDQLRDRDQLRDCDQLEDRDQLRDRDRLCDGDCDGDGVPDQDRDQDRERDHRYEDR